MLNNIKVLPPDQALLLAKRYKEDTCLNKVNLGLGAYKDCNNQPVIFDSVKEAKNRIQNENHEYTSIEGNSLFVDKALELLYGNTIFSNICGVQAISGTGACRLGAEFLSKYALNRKCYIPNPTWINHYNILDKSGLTPCKYNYYKNREIDMKSILKSISDAPRGSIFLMHACGHNPTGIDPNDTQWKQISAAIHFNGLIPFFDCAYLGFVSGDMDIDSFSIRYFTKYHDVVVVAQSFSKNMGLYGERVGVLSVVSPFSKEVVMAA